MVARDPNVLRRWRTRNQEKVRAWGRLHARRRRLRMHGITEADYQQLWHHQGYACAACGATHPGSQKGWVLDHSHETGHVRGILCSGCNIALGHAKDNPVRLRALAAYLERHQ